MVQKLKLWPPPWKFLQRIVGTQLLGVLGCFGTNHFRIWIPVRAWLFCRVKILAATPYQNKTFGTFGTLSLRRLMWQTQSKPILKITRNGCYKPSPNGTCWSLAFPHDIIQKLPTAVLACHGSVKKAFQRPGPGHWEPWHFQAMRHEYEILEREQTGWYRWYPRNCGSLGLIVSDSFSTA